MDDETKRRKSEADEAERFLNEFDEGIAGNIVDDNTLVFDNSDFESAKSQHRDLQNHSHHRCYHRVI